jgi:hypothetical protein
MPYLTWQGTKVYYTTLARLPGIEKGVMGKFAQAAGARDIIIVFILQLF